MAPGRVHAAAGRRASRDQRADPIQGFRHGRSWGLQFHPECDLPLYDAWHTAFPDACTEVGLDPAQMRQTAVDRERDPALFAVLLLDAFASVVLT